MQRRSRMVGLGVFGLAGTLATTGCALSVGPGGVAPPGVDATRVTIDAPRLDAPRADARDVDAARGDVVTTDRPDAVPRDHDDASVLPPTDDVPVRPLEGIVQLALGVNTSTALLRDGTVRWWSESGP